MSFIDSWDSGQPAAFWDFGLQWDVNVGPAPGNVTPYLNLVTSEHRNKPNFIATLAGVLQSFADLQAVMATFPGLFDLDVAVGSQEDELGLWVGVNRNLSEPLLNVYFSLDSATLGLDQGSLQGPFDPTTGLIQLPDSIYRLLLEARIMNNSWDGTIPTAYAIWAALFEGTNFGILIQDLSNMHMIIAMTGAAPDPITLALFLSGELNVRPSGVMIDYYMTPDANGDPYFGLDAETSTICGLDVGAFGFLNNGTGY
jgi:Protein of unknown function (DUF2612)